MDLLRETDTTVTDIALDVGFISLGTFSRTFNTIVGQSPTAYRARFIDGSTGQRVPSCFAMAWMRPAG